MTLMLWEKPVERPHRDAGIDAGGDIGVGIGPGAGVIERIKLGDDQATGKARRAGVGAVDGGAGAGQRQAPGGVKFGEPGQVGRAGGKAAFKTVRHVVADDGIQHGDLRSR
jgi:hypothetical protein